MKSFSSSLYDGELDYIERLLTDDVRNNSAWNQRFFVVTHEASSSGEGLSGDLLRREVDFATSAARKDPANESAWNYLRGLLDACPAAESPSAAAARAAAMEFCESLYSEGARSPHLLGAMVDLLGERMEEEAEEGKGELLERATKLCVDLVRRTSTERMSS